MNENYTKVEVLKYVKEGLESGILKPVVAEKFARILARRGEVSEEVISWSVDENGNAIIEKVDTVKVDEKTGKAGWVVTKATENGEPVIDANGHTNDWIIADSTFIKKYEEVEEMHGFYRPIGGAQIFVCIPDNITLHQWGSDMNIAAGGYINITKIDDMYGISKRDFEDTYKITSTDVKTYKLQ